MDLTHLGAETSVTGSCHLLRVNGLAILVDCGLAQGSEAVLPMDDWPVAPGKIDFLFLTHAHIDHIGRVPELIGKGFGGEIICSHPTRALLNPMLADALKFTGLPEAEARRIRKAIDELSWGFEYGETFDLGKDVAFKLKRAGHILGSSFIRFADAKSGRSVLFSGDLGAADTPILPDPEAPETSDLVVMESTYGDRRHGGRDQRVAHLGQVLARCLADGGKVFIPAFALGRTQELIYEMDRLFSDPHLQARFPELQGAARPPVFLDSPLGLEITKVYAGLSAYWNREARELLRQGDHPMDFKGLYAVADHAAHLRLCEAPGPAVILAGSGMCTGGRIVAHLRQGIERPANDILFVGYQAEGTPGRAIQEWGGKPGGQVELDGARQTIGARVHTLAGYSAHADQQGLVDWLAAMPDKPGAVQLVHGEAAARQALAEVLGQRGYAVQ
jgi:metallo-beta-lactamase family protein